MTLRNETHEPAEADDDALTALLSDHLGFLEEGGRLLVCGPRAAAVAVRTAQQYPAATVVGVCASEQLNERARELAAADNEAAGRVSLVTVAETDVPAWTRVYEPGDFSAVLTLEVAGNGYDRPWFFGAVQRLLAPGGRLVVQEGDMVTTGQAGEPIPDGFGDDAYCAFTFG